MPEDFRSAQTADAYTHRAFSEMLRGCSQTLIHLDKWNTTGKKSFRPTSLFMKKSLPETNCACLNYCSSTPTGKMKLCFLLFMESIKMNFISWYYPSSSHVVWSNIVSSNVILSNVILSNIILSNVILSNVILSNVISSRMQ
jgi:hypothetical protein